MNLKWWHILLIGLGWVLFIGAILQGRATRSDLLDRSHAASVARSDSLRDALAENFREVARRSKQERDSLEREIGIQQRRSGVASSEVRRLKRTLRDEVPIALIPQLDSLEDAHLTSLESCWSAFSDEHSRCATFERELAAAASLRLADSASRDTLRLDRNYWKGEALSLATDFSLVGWLPEGPWRVVGTIVICGGVGTGVGFATSDGMVGAAAAGGCGLAAVAF
jgi:hypothetical protein